MGRTIHCPVCGTDAPMEPYSSNKRESGECRHCLSFNRQRQLALVLLDAVGDLTGARPDSLASLADHRDVQGLRIHSTEIGGAVHETLRRFSGYTCSEYLGPDVASGTVRNGVRHEDLLATSFADESIDIVLSADVMEHIPEPYEAHREIHRTLHTGGRHIFTVPSNMAMPHDEQRAAAVDGSVMWFAPPEYHGAETEALLVYTVFGAEMREHLGALGYDCIVHDLDHPEAGCDGPGAVVYEAKRVAEPTGVAVPTGVRPDRRAALDGPDGPGAQRELAARALLDAGRIDDALEGFMSCADEFGPTPGALLGVADCAIALGDRSSALGVIDLTLTHFPWRWDAVERRDELQDSVAV